MRHWYALFDACCANNNTDSIANHFLSCPYPTGND